jgi:2-oxo-3-hexenedioate decarboxylase
MALDAKKALHYVSKLHEAARSGEPTEMLTRSLGTFELEEAYDMQRSLIQMRVAEGEKIVGMKMGLTSRAKMEQVGVHEPIYGHLTDAMQLSSGASLRCAAHCHPRIEPEIAFLLKTDLEGPTTFEKSESAIESVGAAMEVIDSRYKNFQFTLTDVVADNASSSHFVLPPVWIPWGETEIDRLDIQLCRNGKVEQEGNSSAILDHPVCSLEALANALSMRGEKLSAGMIILAGAATAAIELHPGDLIEMKAGDWPTPSLYAR